MPGIEIHPKPMNSFFRLFAFIVIACLFSLLPAQQTGTITGTVVDRNTQEPLIGATIVVEGQNLGALSDDEGNYKITGIPARSWNLKATYLGYEPLVKYNLVVTSGNVMVINFELAAADIQGQAVDIQASRKIQVTSIETPNSVQRLSSEEIKSNPGGNFDISRVVQALPGVGGTAGSVGGFRNDLVIRGGAPNENVYYLDGIEVPVINHFATQGAAGGPTGILNVSFIEEATLSSSSFNARYDNALSSVLQFKQRDGNSERRQGNIRLSGTELAATFEGPLAKNVTFLASARRSYLQFLFQALDLPIRPNYWDFQYKVSWKPNPKTTFTAIGIGAIDEFRFGVPKETSLEKEYILRSNPNINQWNYTTGFAMKRLLNKGYLNIALSRNMFDNSLDKFEDNREGEETLRTLGSKSQEIENKLRIDVNKVAGPWKYSYGAVLQYVKYNNDFYSRLRPEIRDSAGTLIQPELALRFNTAIDFARYGLFGQVSRSFNQRLNLSFGLRSDANTFSSDGVANLLNTLSPRLSAAYELTPKWKLNASLGRYYKLPIYTVLGFRNTDGELVNRDNRYIRSDHAVAGLEWLPTPATRITVEGFHKWYDFYPVSVINGISLANQGGDFNVVGNEAVRSIGNGRSYGMELFVQQKLSGNIYAVGSYTLFWSKFGGFSGELIPSAWDTRHLLSLLFGRKFNKGWEMGLKYRYQGGAPLTPFDLEASQRNYATLGVGILDLEQLNSERLRYFSQFDFRIDKKWNFKRSTLDVFFDITNAFVQSNPAYPNYTFQRNADNSGFATTNGGPLLPDGSNAIPVILSNNDAVPVPTIGFIVEF